MVALGRRSKLLLVFLLLVPSVSAFTLFQAAEDDFVTVDCDGSWVVGSTYDITVKTRENVQDMSVSILDANGNGFSPDAAPVSENGVYIFSVKVPVVDSGDYYVKATAFNGVQDFTGVKKVHIRNSLWRWVKLEYALFIDWWTS